MPSLRCSDMFASVAVAAWVLAVGGSGGVEGAPRYVDGFVGFKVPSGPHALKAIQSRVGDGLSFTGEGCAGDVCLCYQLRSGGLLVLEFGTDEFLNGVEVLSASEREGLPAVCPVARGASGRTERGVALGAPSAVVSRTYGPPQKMARLDGVVEWSWDTEHARCPAVSMSYELRVRARHGRVTRVRIYDGP